MITIILLLSLMKSIFTINHDNGIIIVNFFVIFHNLQDYFTKMYTVITYFYQKMQYIAEILKKNV